jgi:urea transporter
MDERKFWQILQAGSLAGWFYILFGAAFPFETQWLKILWWCVTPVWAIGHPLELAISLPIGREKGLKPEWAAAMTLLFGFTWWLPLKRGMRTDPV